MDPSHKIRSRRTGSLLIKAALILSCIGFEGCSGLPRLVILHEPLTPHEHVHLGRSYEAQGKMELAEAQYQAALNIQQDFIPALEALGDLYASDRRFPEAEGFYERALRADGNRPRVLNNLGWIYSLRGIKMEKGERLIRRAIEIDPDQKAYYLDTLAGLYIRMGKFERAEKILREARKWSSGDSRLEASLEEKGKRVKARNRFFSDPADPVLQEEIPGGPK